MACRTASRSRLPESAVACSVSSSAPSELNRNSATNTLASVSAVRSGLRPRFTSTRRNMGASGLAGEHALVEMHHAVRLLGGVRVVGDHDDGLLELGVEPLEQLEDLL